MTQRLYYTDSYLTEFEATVVDRADDGRRVYLDRTAFYPTSGGQPFDTGQLGGVEVMDVVDEGERIAHLLSGPMPGGRIVGRINWARRFDHMQQHTGQHLLSAVLADLLGHTTVGVHFGRDSSTLDLDAGTLAADQVARAEARANEIAVENRPVRVSFEEGSSANGLRKPPTRARTLRIVTIYDLDRSACGGTHVRATGEIGPILIGRVERVRKGIRLEFLCGGRAIRRARSDHDLLARLASEFSAAPEELPALTAAQRGDLKDADAARRELQEKLDLYRARELYAAAEPDATGVRRVTLRGEAASIDGLRGVAQAFASLPRAIFVGTVPSPPAVLLAASPDAGIDAAGVLKSLLTSVGGRGGGSATMAQGIVPGRAQLDSVVESIAGGPGAGVGSKV
ncbi:MAG TPA: DHHA1 domain-containing protein [Gemmatimonadales bacterium]|nr:DHHA1 domain-containing protein [Gemmatimonadales bacterium]